MASKKKFLTDKQLTLIGRRHGSANVQAEASEASARWERDLGVLRSFGSGAALKAKFEADRKAHAALLTDRPDGVANKATVIGARDSATSRAWLWVDQAAGVLGVLARDDQAVATELAATLPDDDSDLPTAIPALAKLLVRHLAALPDDADVQLRIDEAPALAQALTDAPGEVSAAKAAPIADTAEIDLLDGKLYTAITALNEAGKRAIQHGQLNRQRSEYRLDKLAHSGPKKPDQPPS